MATIVPLPKLGNTVETVIVLHWRKAVGESVAVGDTLLEVETDKASMDVESQTSGTVLAHLVKEGDEVPVMTPIVVIGEAGEQWGADEAPQLLANPEPLSPPMADTAASSVSHMPFPRVQGKGSKSQMDYHETHSPAASVERLVSANGTTQVDTKDEQLKISPRARLLAIRKGIDFSTLQGSGPQGRIIERDVQAAIASKVRPTPVARSMMEKGGFGLPAGAAGRVGAHDLVTPPVASSPVTVPDTNSESIWKTLTPRPPLPQGEGEQSTSPSSGGGLSNTLSDDVTVIPLKGTRKLIAQRMLESVQLTAQLTLHRSGDARALKRLRERLKGSAAELGLQGVTINDLVLFAVSRTLLQHLNLNSLLVDNAIHQYQRVHLGVAVDTPRGLLVPVIRDAHQLTLKQLSDEARRLILACTDGKITPDELNGGTFTVTNLGGLGIEQFTPILNLPQSAILGVGNIQLKAIETEDGIEFLPHISLSLTINHQIIDGAPAARFLATLAAYISDIDVVLAI